MAYVPQVGQAVCASFFSRQLVQVTIAAALVFHCERRLRVLEREVFRFGTATVHPNLCVLLSLCIANGQRECRTGEPHKCRASRGVPLPLAVVRRHEATEGGPAGVDLLMSMLGRLGEQNATFWT